MVARAALLAIAFAAASTLSSPAHARANAGPKEAIYNCKENWEPNTTICSSRVLRSAVSEIEGHYSRLRITADTEIKYLADQGREYFRLNVWNCRNLPTYPAGTPSCVRSAILNEKTVLRGHVTKTALVENIAASGAFDAGLVERYPKSFLRLTARICGDVDMHSEGKRLVGRFRDCRTKKWYPIEYERPAKDDLQFYSVHPAIMSWFVGRFERQGSRLKFIALNQDDAEAWWKKAAEVSN